MGEGWVYELTWFTFALGGAGDKGSGIDGSEGEEETEVAGGFHGCYWEG